MMPVLQVGRLALQLPGLLLLLGVWVGVSASEAAARRRSLSPERTTAIIGISLACGLISARLGFVLAHLSAYLPRPLDALSLNPSALDLHTGLVGGAILAVVAAQRRSIPLLTLLDVLAPGLAGFSIFLGLAHLAGGAAFGAESGLPWAIRLWGADRHPTQVYEAMAGLVAWMVVRRRIDRLPGQTFLLWLATASSSTLVIEGFRGDSVLGPGGIRILQLPALFLAVLSLWLYGGLARRPDLRASPGSPPIDA